MCEEDDCSYTREKSILDQNEKELYMIRTYSRVYEDKIDINEYMRKEAEELRNIGSKLLAKKKDLENEICRLNKSCQCFKQKLTACGACEFPDPSKKEHKSKCSKSRGDSCGHNMCGSSGKNKRKSSSGDCGKSSRDCSAEKALCKSSHRECSKPPRDDCCKESKRCGKSHEKESIKICGACKSHRKESSSKMEKSRFDCPDFYA